MDYLILDTNIYINLCLRRVDTVTAPCLEGLKKLLDDNRLKIVLPEIVRIEFERNIEPVFENSQNFLKSVINEIDKIVLPHDITVKLRKETTMHLHKILSKFKNMDINEQIMPVLDIMDHGNTDVIRTTDDLLIQTIKRVIERRAPAHNKNKRSEADCLIVEAVLSYFSKVKGSGKVFFVTDNKSDFSNPDKKTELHPHLQLSFSKANIRYDPHLAKILKDQFALDIDKADIEFEEEIIKKPIYQPRQFQGNFDLNFGSSFAHMAGFGEGSGVLTLAGSTGPIQDSYQEWLSNMQKGEGI